MQPDSNSTTKEKVLYIGQEKIIFVVAALGFLLLVGGIIFIAKKADTPKSLTPTPSPDGNQLTTFGREVPAQLPNQPQVAGAKYGPTFTATPKPSTKSATPPLTSGPSSSPTSSPSSTPSPSPSESPTSSPTPTDSPTPTPSPSPTNSPSPTPSPS